MDDDDDSDDDNDDIHYDAEIEQWAAGRQRERDEQMRKIETNDRTFTTLKINSGRTENYWMELGPAIGRNTQLTNIIVKNIPAIDFRNFARSLVLNRSIQRLSIAGWDHSDREAWDHLTRFFIDNEACKCLDLELRCSVGRSDEMVSALRRFHSLKEVRLSHFSHTSRNNGVCVDYVINALIEHHTDLTKLIITGMDIGRGGCAALATSSLNELHLQYCPYIDDEGASIFAAGLARNTTLKVLSINGARNITDIAWQSIFTAFSTCKVESLILDSNGLNDTTIHPLTNAFCRNTTLKSLNLSRNWGVTNSGWATLLTSLHGVMLEKLDISYNSIGDIGVKALANALVNNSCLRELDLSYNSISGAGVNALASVLHNPNSALEMFSIGGNSTGDIGVTAISTILLHPSSTLEKLDISRNSISDIGMNALTDALVNNRMLKELSIDENPDVTPAGWANFSNVLRNPTSALEMLKVWGYSINEEDVLNDEVVQSFVDALANNKKLKELNVGNFSYLVNEWNPESYAPMANILCNTSSILNTFNSNHTLERVCNMWSDSLLPLESLLQINRENSVSAAARLKIIKTHFRGSEINMQPFMVMGLSVRPHAIAWMAKDMHLYELLRAMPSLLERIDKNVRSTKRLRS
jgi:Ran GTPase-activating protein (RanGAP) involved in mRNA processing and transport